MASSMIIPLRILAKVRQLHASWVSWIFCPVDVHGGDLDPDILSESREIQAIHVVSIWELVVVMRQLFFVVIP